MTNPPSTNFLLDRPPIAKNKIQIQCNRQIAPEDGMKSHKRRLGRSFMGYSNKIRRGKDRVGLVVATR
jgi:hypothetical protein